MSKLTEYLEKQNFTVTKEINTNNDWGFGGAIKDVYEKDGISVSIGTAYFRHAPKETFIRVNKPECIFNDFNTPSKQAKCITILDDLINNITI